MSEHRGSSRASRARPLPDHCGRAAERGRRPSPPVPVRPGTEDRPRRSATTVLDVDGLDQPAIRGLLTLLWDLGHDVVAVISQPKERLS